MTGGRTVLLAILASCALWLGYVAYVAEAGIADRRETRAGLPNYWRCERLPDTATLRRVYVNLLIFDRDDAASSLRRGIWFLSLKPYVSVRVGRDEIVDDFLKTPSHYEKGCLPIPRENAMSAQ